MTVIVSIMVMMMTKKMTYKELSEHLAIKLPSARRLVMRKKWHKVKGNDGETRISVPDDFLIHRDSRYDDNHNDGHDVRSDKNDDVIMTLKIENAALKASLEAEKNRADTAETDRDRWYEVANKSWFRRLF